MKRQRLLIGGLVGAAGAIVGVRVGVPRLGRPHTLSGYV